MKIQIIQLENAVDTNFSEYIKCAFIKFQADFQKNIIYFLTCNRFPRFYARDKNNLAWLSLKTVYDDIFS